VYRTDGRLLWDADLAGPAEAVTVLPAERGRSAVVRAASGAGYVCEFDGPSGGRRSYDRDET
jgi:hypothetical protein